MFSRPRLSEAKNADAALIERARHGDIDAYGDLWRRHHAAAIRAARLFTTSLDAEDLVSEAYVQILATLRRGSGPQGTPFRPYLYTVVRNLARRWGAARQEITVKDFPELADENDSLRIQIDTLDRGMVRDAFVGLPRRWQEVLWYTEVEGMTPAQVGVLLGMGAGSVSALAYRAREGLRQHWLQAHIADAQRAGECAWALERMGEHSRDRLTSRNRIRMEAHLDECESCRSIAREVEVVSDQLAAILAPIFLGGGAAAAWLSSLSQAGGTAAAAAAGASASAGGAAVSGLGAGVAIGAGTTSVITLLGVIGGLVLAPVGPGPGDDREGAAQSGETVDAASFEGPLGPVLDRRDVPGADAPPAPPGQELQDAVTGATDGVGELLNGTTGAVGELVNGLTGGLVTTDIRVDLGLDAPGVTVGAGVGGVDVGAGVQLGSDGAGVSLGVGGILEVEVDLGGEGLLGIGLFGLGLR